MSSMVRGPDLQGQRFGLLTVVSAHSKMPNGARVWACRCDCGADCNVTTARLRSGQKTTCGCRGIGFRKHGHTIGKRESPTYVSWASMIARCTQPTTANYKSYGGRGISVCARWKVFANFLDDMGERPPGMTIDRLDNNRNYDPDNCRWATHAQQSQNLRSNKLNAESVKRISELIDLGESIATLASKFDVSIATIRSIRKGKSWWSVTGRQYDPEVDYRSPRHRT